MVVLKNSKSEFTMEIEGYAYPFAQDDWDANWLQVKITIKDIENAIDFEQSDPCLLTMELVDLYEWLSNIEKSKKGETNLKFMEPNMSFSYTEDILHIILRYAFNPSGNFEGIYKMEFKMNHKILNTLLLNIREAIYRFPKKLDPR